MSFLRKTSNNNSCNACNVKPDTGAISLQIVPSPNQVNENQSKGALRMQTTLANDIQAKYLANMDLQSCNTHMKTCDNEQCNEVTYNSKVALHALPSLLNKSNLTMRVNHMEHGIDSQATCAEVTHENLLEMLQTGGTEVSATLGGTFKLHSNDNNTITSVKYFPE